MSRTPHHNSLAVGAWSVTAAFVTYFCMYGFRKPFTAAGYTGQTLGGIDFKTVLVSAQVLGYMVSKFIGIKVVAEMSPRHRAAAILVLIAASHLALLGFGLVPAPYNFAFLFLNGLPLGMVFGLVVGFIEGRRHTEALAAGLCASFIVADGFTKTVGKALLDGGVPEQWMPFVAGLVFAPPLAVGVWMLSRVPPPDAADVAERSVRKPLNRADRRRFFARHATALVPLVAMYLLVTVQRSMRADFAPELWAGLGEPAAPAVFTQSELIIALVVLAATGATALVRNNRLAFGLSLATCLAGLVLIALALLGLRAGQIGGFAFMVCVGLGLYLPYVAVQTTLLERLIALTREPGNLGYLVSLADAVGYLGYVAVMIGRAVFAPGNNLLTFFEGASWLVALASVACIALTWHGLGRK
ncbi:MAG: DUF5690 family protein [Limisphaerales bacterium]